LTVASWLDANWQTLALAVRLDRKGKVAKRHSDEDHLEGIMLIVLLAVVGIGFLIFVLRMLYLVWAFWMFTGRDT